jgi:hypothetical protein
MGRHQRRSVGGVVEPERLARARPKTGRWWILIVACRFDAHPCGVAVKGLSI